MNHELNYHMSKLSMKYSILIVVLATGMFASAQDTTKGKTVNVTSSFKPSLKEAAKINFNASPPASDTSRPRLQYNIPNQNLSLGFQPASLKPLALQVDTGGTWRNESFVKLGYGNLKTPYLQAGVSFGDGRTAGLNVYARHSSSKGNLPFQDYSNTEAELNAYLKSAKNLQWNIRFGGKQETYNKYGFQPETLVFPDDSIKIKYNTWSGRVNFHNITRTDLGLSYAPEVKIDIINNQLSTSESNTYVNLPLQKTLGEAWEVDLAATGNLSRLKPDNKSAVVNNYLYLSPSVLFKKANINISAGVRPSWDNSSFKVLPNIMAEFKTPNYPFSFQLGWTGYLRNSGFQYQAGMNPWIWAPDTSYNTRIIEAYAGIKGSAADHFSYSLKAGYNTFTNQPLFINDTASGKSFLTVNEPRLQELTLGGELGYTVGEKFSLISNVSINTYHTKTNDRAWGLLPMEWKTSLRFEVLRDL